VDQVIMMKVEDIPVFLEDIFTQKREKLTVYVACFKVKLP